MKKLLIIILLFMLMPSVHAEEEECGLLNMASCIPQKIYDFLLNVINAPISPLLEFTQTLLTEPVDMSLFTPLWAIMLYIISLFYGILMLYSGFTFMVSGYDSAKRAKAKEWFRNIFIMIVLVQASYFIYAAIVDIGSLLTAGVINLCDENFFRLTADNIVNIGLQFFFALIYVLTLLLTVFLLVCRYIIVAVGVVFSPLAIFFYFIPPLRDYGKLIMNFLGICIFITFFDALIFLVCSKLVEITLFENFKIPVMITAFGLSNLLMFYLMFFSAIKSAINLGSKSVGTAKTVVAVAKYFI